MVLYLFFAALLVTVLPRLICHCSLLSCLLCAVVFQDSVASLIPPSAFRIVLAFFSIRCASLLLVHDFISPRFSAPTFLPCALPPHRLFFLLIVLNFRRRRLTFSLALHLLLHLLLPLHHHVATNQWQLVDTIAIMLCELFQREHRFEKEISEPCRMEEAKMELNFDEYEK